MDFCKEKECVVVNTMFEHKDIHKYTREDPTMNLKLIIDLIIMKTYRKTAPNDVKVYSSRNMPVSSFGGFRCNICYRKKEKKTMNMQRDLTAYKEIVFKTDLLKQYRICKLYRDV